MGKLFDDFGSLNFHNEAEVSQNFILPLLQNYLGYDSQEILPEHYYIAKDVFSGVKFSEGGSKSFNHRPDFVICQDGDVAQPKFIIDSKGPDEGIDDHLGQLRSYAISVGKNFLMMTNGKELKVYDVNNLLFHSADMADLQSKVEYLLELLGRDNQVQKSDVHILKEFNYEGAIRGVGTTGTDFELRRKQVLLADFKNYLQNLKTSLVNWHLPTQHFHAIDNLEHRKIDPNMLLAFRPHKTDLDRFPENKTLKLQQIESDDAVKIKLFIGETGTGKSSLLRYLAHKAAMQCLEYMETRIPVFISLREIGPNYKLEDLVIATLNRNGYACGSFFELPTKNDFIFFFDAYDEIGEIFRVEVFSVIQHLSRSSFCFVTTRPNIIHTFQLSTAYDLLPISEAQIKNVVRQHIGNRYYEFQRQLDQHTLQVESGNILLLLFLISLFKETGTFPSTLSKIIVAIVTRVKVWQDSKSAQSKPIKWEALGFILAGLAYELFHSEEIALTRTVAEPILIAKITVLEHQRKLPQGMTIEDVLNLLAQTGLLIVNQNHLYFWHRLFLNHFAALGLKESFLNDNSTVSSIAADKRWNVVVVGLATLLPSITRLVALLQDSLWLSAYCLAENNHCDEDQANSIISELIRQTESVVPDIRQKAARYLATIDLELSQKFFFSVFDNDECYNDVKMIALSTIGKTRSPEAKNIIYQHLEWDESLFLTCPSAPANVVRGLYYYGETEHLQIIDNWKKTSDYLMNLECKNIFIELHSQNRLTPQLISALQDLYVFEYHAKHHGQDKLDAISKILALVPNDDFGTLILEFPHDDKELSKVDSIYELLKEYQSPAIIELVKAKVFDAAVEYYTAEKLAEIIVDSACEVPKEIFYGLIAHENTNIASRAIGALKRFNYAEVKAIVEKHLYAGQPQLQSWALGVLVDNGEIVRLIRQERFPNSFFEPAAHTLLKGIRRFHLTEGLPLMQQIRDALFQRQQYSYDINLAIGLAGTYYLMGESEKHAEIIGWFFDGDRFLQNSDNLHFHLMDGLQFFEPALAAAIADCYYRTYFPVGDSVRFKTNVFLDAVDKLGQQSLVPHVKAIADALLADAKQGKEHAGYELERPMRTLVKLVVSTDEDWILERIDATNYNDGFEFTQLRRAAECLTFAGTAKSLPYLKQIARQRIDNEMILNTCQYAYESICRRIKIPFNKGDLLQD